MRYASEKRSVKYNPFKYNSQVQTNDVRYPPWNPVILKIRDSKKRISGKYYIGTFRILDDASIAYTGIYYMPKSIFGKV